MNPIYRKMLYLGIVPFLFCVNIMVTIAWWNTTPLMAVLVLFFVFLRVAERHESLDRFNDFMKGIAFRLFPDVYEKGILTNARFILAVAPCIACMIMNILIERI